MKIIKHRLALLNSALTLNGLFFVEYEFILSWLKGEKVRHLATLRIVTRVCGEKIAIVSLWAGNGRSRF